MSSRMDAEQHEFNDLSNLTSLIFIPAGTCRTNFSSLHPGCHMYPFLRPNLYQRALHHMRSSPANVLHSFSFSRKDPLPPPLPQLKIFSICVYEGGSRARMVQFEVDLNLIGPRVMEALQCIRAKRKDIPSESFPEKTCIGPRCEDIIGCSGAFCHLFLFLLVG